MLQIQKEKSPLFYFLLSLPATAMGFALCVQLSTLSWKLDQLGLKEADLGKVWSAGPIAGIVGQILFGLISDKAWFWGGRRRPYILIGGVITALAIFGLSQLEFLNAKFPMLGLVVCATSIALMLDLAVNIGFNPTRSLISDVTSEGADRTKGYTIMQLVSGSFGVAAYFFGALLGKEFLFYFGVVLVLLFTIIPTLLIQEPKELAVANPKSKIQNLKSTTDWPNFLKLCFAHAFTWFGIQSMFIFFGGFLKYRISNAEVESGLLQQLHAVFPNVESYGRMQDISFTLMFLVGSLLPAFALEPLAKKFGRVRVHLTTVAIMSASYFALYKIADSQLSVFFFMCMLGIGWGAVVSLPFAIFSEMVDKNRMGWFMGLFNLSVVIPQLLVSFTVGSFLQNSTDKSLVFLISGIALAISAVLWLLVKEKTKE